MDAPTTKNLDAIVNIDENEESIKKIVMPNLKKIHFNKRKGRGLLWFGMTLMKLFFLMEQKIFNIFTALKDLPTVIMVQQHNTIGTWNVV